MKELESKAVELITKLEDLTEQFAPEVIDAALSVVQVSAISNLVGGVIWLLVALGVNHILNEWKRRTNYPKKDSWTYDQQDQFGVSLGIRIVLVLITLLVWSYSFLSTWNWVAIFNPKLALAHKLLGL